MAASGFSANVDMSLDELVTKNKNSMRYRGRRGRGRFGGNSMQNNRRPRMGQNGRRPFSVGKRSRRQLPDVWDKGSLLERGNAVISNATKDVVISSNRLLVTNLNFDVTDNDIKELFSTCGELKKAVINYDNTGHSNGTAEVVYFDRSSSQKAYNTFNGVCLDKRPLKIQYLDCPDASKTSVSRLTFPPPMRRVSGGFYSGVGARNTPFNTRGRGRGGRRGRGRMSGGRKAPKSTDALDQEMIDYQNNEVEMK